MPAFPFLPPFGPSSAAALRRPTSPIRGWHCLPVTVQLGLDLGREVPHQIAVLGAARLPHG